MPFFVGANMSFKILIVDDEEFIHRSIQNVLRKKKYNIESVYSGPKALEVIEKKQPDLILLDINIGDMNGIEVLKIVKQKYPQIIVIIKLINRIVFFIFFPPQGFFCLFVRLF